MEHYLSLAIKAIFVENILLAFFLGMCSFLACSKKLEVAIGLSFAVIFVLAITVPMNWAIYHFFLRPGALHWIGLPQVDLSFLSFITYIAVIAALTQLVEMVLDKYSPVLHHALGIFLPLIAVNCSILGGSLFMQERGYNFAESCVYGVGAGIGWALAMVAMAACRKKLRYANIPKGLQGLGITMLMTGLMAMAFMCFSGIDL